jgi:hypothetical protein
MTVRRAVRKKFDPARQLAANFLSLLYEECGKRRTYIREYRLTHLTIDLRVCDGDSEKIFHKLCRAANYVLDGSWHHYKKETEAYGIKIGTFMEYQKPLIAELALLGSMTAKAHV